MITPEHKALVDALIRKAETDGLLSVEDIREVAEPLYAQCAQPANPAQVTDAMVTAFIKASSTAVGDTEDCVRAGVSAAIGAGGQAVAESLWVPAKSEHKNIGWTYDFDQTEQLSRAAEKATGYDATMEVIEFVMTEADRRYKSALASNKPAGDGYVLVPKEPTEEMIDAGDRVMYGRYGCSFEVAPIYKAMLAASGEASR